jgi:hypothetical protein
VGLASAANGETLVMTPRRPKFPLPGSAVLLALVCLALPTPVLAEEGSEATHAAFFRHDLAIFLGVTEDRSSEELTQGVEYEYRIVSWFGAGGLVDFAFGEERATLVAIAAYFRPTHRLKLILAPGYERFESTAHEKGKTEFALRIGATYDFEITEKFYLAPALNLDFVDGDKIWVWGLNLGFKLGEPR